MVRTLATWMAPVLCFTAQDVGRRACAGHRRALRRARRGARRAGSCRQGAQEPQQAVERRDPPAPAGDPAHRSRPSAPRAQVARGASRRSSRPPPSGRTGSGTSTTCSSSAWSRRSPCHPRTPPGRPRSPCCRGARAASARAAGGAPGGPDLPVGEAMLCGRCAQVVGTIQEPGPQAAEQVCMTPDRRKYIALRGGGRGGHPARPVDEGAGPRGTSSTSATPAARSSTASSPCATRRTPGVAFGMLQSLSRRPHHPHAGRPGGLRAGRSTTCTRATATTPAAGGARPGGRRRHRQPDRSHRLRRRHRLPGLRPGRSGRFNPWPAFNIADAALVVGVGLMAIDMARPQRATAATEAKGR